MKLKKSKRPDPGVVKKTISLPEDLLRRAELKAAAEQRNFSNYVATLIRRDALAA